MNKPLVHRHLIIRAEAINPPMRKDYLLGWFKKFIEKIGMKIMMGPYIKYCNMKGNKGITGAAIIETSHIVMHVWDEPVPAIIQFDLYSCGEFDELDICEKIKKDFNCSQISYKFLDREKEIIEYHKLKIAS